MKKLFAFIACTILLLCALPVSAFAEGEILDAGEVNTEEVETLPTEEETPVEEEIFPTEDKDTAVEQTPAEEEKPSETKSSNITPEKIVAFIKKHYEGISVIVSLIVMAIYKIQRDKALNRSIAATNNNAIVVSNRSDKTITDAMNRMEGISTDVSGYKEAFASLLAEYRQSEDEKRQLQNTLNEAMTYIKSSKLANIEFANELAELLVLANIPNAKKDELYARHIAAVKSIADSENTEVINNDGGKEA